MTGTPRGRLPARVYWTRRLMVLGTAVLLVVGIARVLGSGSDASSGDDHAGLTAAGTSSGPTTGSTTGATSRNTKDPSSTTTSGHKHLHTQSTQPPVSMPSGPCSSEDISVTPSVPDPVGGSDIKLVFDISTLTTPACDWKLSSKTLALKITSGPDLIWTTTQCPAAIPTKDLVLRSTDPTRVKILWNARRSEPGCPRLTDWARPGGYHLHVAALAGQPQDIYFGLVAPTPPEVTQTVQPHGHKHKHHHTTG
jgi:hypothetical protein